MKKMKKLFCCVIAVLTLLCGCANGEEDFEERYTVEAESVVSLSTLVEAPPVEEVETEPETELETALEPETEPETIADTTPETLPAIVTPTTPAVVDAPIETEPEMVPVETEPEPQPVVIETTVETETEPVIVETEPPVPETEPETVAETEPVPETETPTEITYVLNKNSKKFHLPTCASAKKIKAENYEAFTGTRDEAIAAGYEPCKKCKP